MKLKKDLSIRKIGDDYMVVSNNDTNINYTHITSLNESAVYLLENTEADSEFASSDWVNLLLERYEVDAETAQKDVDKMIEDLIKAGIIIEE